MAYNELLRKKRVYKLNINFTGLLALVFIVLKLTGHINWPWVFVLMPIWIPIIIIIILSFIQVILEEFKGR